MNLWIACCIEVSQLYVVIVGVNLQPFKNVNVVLSLQTMENLVAPISLASQEVASDGQPNKTDDAKKPAPLTGGCRIEGFVRVKKVLFT